MELKDAVERAKVIHTSNYLYPVKLEKFIYDIYYDFEMEVENKEETIAEQRAEIRRLKDKLTLSIDKTRQYINMYHDLLESEKEESK